MVSVCVCVCVCVSVSVCAGVRAHVYMCVSACVCACVYTRPVLQLTVKKPCSQGFSQCPELTDRQTVIAYLIHDFLASVMDARVDAGLPQILF